jgi:hypothetical protein
VKSLQTGCPGYLILLLSLEGRERTERQLHKRFRSLRVRGEWFRPGPDLLEFLINPDLPKAVSRLSWKELVSLEPRLDALLQEARSYHQFDTKDFCANDAWYRGPDWREKTDEERRGRSLKGRMCNLVGFTRRPSHPVLSTMKAFDVASETIYEALPDCRGVCVGTSCA